MFTARDVNQFLLLRSQENCKKTRELNVLSKLCSYLAGARWPGAFERGWLGLRAIIWLLGGVRGGPYVLPCRRETGCGAAASCGGPYKRVNSVLLAVNILRVRRSACVVLSLSLSPSFSRARFPDLFLCLSVSLSLSLPRAIDTHANKAARNSERHPVYKPP